ncbi:hypothetical protein [Salmon gill poxvirus]
MSYVWNTYFRTLVVTEMNQLIKLYEKNYDSTSDKFMILKKKFSIMDFISDTVYDQKFDLLKNLFGHELTEDISEHNKTQLMISIFSDYPVYYRTDDTRPVQIQNVTNKLKNVFIVYKKKTNNTEIFHDQTFYETLSKSVDHQHNFYSIYYWMTRSNK